MTNISDVFNTYNYSTIINTEIAINCQHLYLTILYPTNIQIKVVSLRATGMFTTATPSLTSATEKKHLTTAVLKMARRSTCEKIEYHMLSLTLS